MEIIVENNYIYGLHFYGTFIGKIPKSFHRKEFRHMSTSKTIINAIVKNEYTYNVFADINGRQFINLYIEIKCDNDKFKLTLPIYKEYHEDELCCSHCDDDDDWWSHYVSKSRV